MMPVLFDDATVAELGFSETIHLDFPFRGTFLTTLVGLIGTRLALPLGFASAEVDLITLCESSLLFATIEDLMKAGDVADDKIFTSDKLFFVGREAFFLKTLKVGLFSSKPVDDFTVILGFETNLTRGVLPVTGL